MKKILPARRAALLLVVLLAAVPCASAQPAPDETFRPPLLGDVEARFAAIDTRGTHGAACAGGLIPKPLYRAFITNYLFGLRNHFQGIQRLPDPDFLIVSGADKKKSSDLFIVRFSRGRDTESPSCNADVVAKVVVDDVMWHAGGISTLGSMLAVPVYGGTPRTAKIVFYDFSLPESPVRLSAEIARPGRKATAVAITRLANGRFLVAVLAGFDGLPRRVDFYLSRTAALADGFEPEPVTWRASDVEARAGQERTFSHFQSINFVSQSDGRLYLVGFHNSVAPQTFLPGRDYADLYEVAFPAAMSDGPEAKLTMPTVTKVANRRFHCSGGYCNLDAAAGLFVDPVTQAISVFATPGWLASGKIKMTIYGSRGKPVDAQ